MWLIDAFLTDAYRSSKETVNCSSMNPRHRKFSQTAITANFSAQSQWVRTVTARALIKVTSMKFITQIVTFFLRPAVAGSGLH